MSSCIAGQDQRSAVAIFLTCMSVRVCRPKLFKNLCLSLVSLLFLGLHPWQFYFQMSDYLTQAVFTRLPGLVFFIRSDKNGLFTNGHRVCKMAVKTLLPVTLQNADRFSIVFIIDSKFYNILVFFKISTHLKHVTTLHYIENVWYFLTVYCTSYVSEISVLWLRCG